jgi:carbonic anhydrase
MNKNTSPFYAGIAAVLLTCATVAYASGPSAWDYDDAAHSGPAYWGELSHDYHMCKEGRHQSPVDIHAGANKKMKALKFKYGDTPLSIVNNGHTVQVNYKAGSQLVIGKDSYQLLQFHFHSPSEHTDEGMAYPMEVHFVHQNSKGELAVVGAFIREAEENPVFGQVIANAPHQVSRVDISRISLNAKTLLGRGKAKGYVTYNGSLTTPPCSEGVRWFVLNKPISFSAEQIRAFRKLMHHDNARPTQPLNDRVVYLNRR